MNNELKEVKLKHVHEGQEFSWFPRAYPSMIAVSKHDKVTICDSLHGLGCYPYDNNLKVYVKKMPRGYGIFEFLRRRFNELIEKGKTWQTKELTTL